MQGCAATNLISRDQALICTSLAFTSGFLHDVCSKMVWRPGCRVQRELCEKGRLILNTGSKHLLVRVPCAPLSKVSRPNSLMIGYSTTAGPRLFPSLCVPLPVHWAGSRWRRVHESNEAILRVPPLKRATFDCPTPSANIPGTRLFDPLHSRRYSTLGPSTCEEGLF